MEINLKDLIKMNLQPDMIEGICKAVINKADRSYYNNDGHFVEEIRSYIEEAKPKFDHWIYLKFKDIIEKYYSNFNPHTIPNPERFLPNYLKDENRNNDSTWNAYAVKVGKKDIQSIIQKGYSSLPKYDIEALDKEKIDLTPFFKDVVDRKKFNLVQDFFPLQILNYKLLMDEYGVKYLRMIGQLEYHYTIKSKFLGNLTDGALGQCTPLQQVRILHYYLKNDSETLLKISSALIDKLVFTFRFQSGPHKHEAEDIKERYKNAGGQI